MLTAFPLPPSPARGTPPDVMLAGNRSFAAVPRREPGGEILGSLQRSEVCVGPLLRPREDRKPARMHLGICSFIWPLFSLKAERNYPAGRRTWRRHELSRSAISRSCAHGLQQLQARTTHKPCQQDCSRTLPQAHQGIAAPRSRLPCSRMRTPLDRRRRYDRSHGARPCQHQPARCPDTATPVRAQLGLPAGLL